jgi:hypothetical protein
LTNAFFEFGFVLSVVCCQLKLGPIDQFPYVGKFFSVNVFLVNEVKETIGKTVPFTISLYAGESLDQMSPMENGIEIDKNSKLEIPCGAGGASAQVNVKILQASGVSLFNARKFYLVAQPSLSEHFHSISSGFSDPLVAVNYRLVITNGHELPPIYYNATKGKGNKMELRVRLLDSEGNTVLDRPNLKLNFILHYEDNTTVDQSEKKMLEIASDSKLFLGETGEAVIRFRIINAVSRKHGNRRFKLSISADSVQNAARYNDVSFDYSPSVDVRTKVDEKARARRMAKKSGLQSLLGAGADAATDKSDPDDDPPPSLDPALKKQKTEPQLERPLSISFLDIPSFAPSFSSYTAGSYGQPSLAANVWAENTLAKLETLRWKEVESGNSKSDHEAVTTGVYNGYEISNPNAIIDEIIEASKTFLKPPSSDSVFVAGCDQAASIGPLTTRAHSLAYRP